MERDPVDPMEVRDFSGTGSAADVLPTFSPGEDKFFAGLARRQIVLQRCTACQRARFPIAPACPYCSTSTHSWDALTPGGVVHSWVRYHRAFLPEFAPLVPYVVFAVELADGPIICGRFVDDDLVPRIGMPVRAIVERWSDGGHLLAFTAELEKP